MKCLGFIGCFIPHICTEHTVQAMFRSTCAGIGSHCVLCFVMQLFAAHFHIRVRRVRLITPPATVVHWGRQEADSGACDQWYIDDGQVFLRPSLVEPWLKAFDVAVAAFGGTRGTIVGGDAKSSARHGALLFDA